MERLRNLAREALTWEHLSQHQRLVWAASLELDVVPVQEMRRVDRGRFYSCVCLASSSWLLFLTLQELPPWFRERQNITRRPPGRVTCRCSRVSQRISHSAHTKPSSLAFLHSILC